MCIILVVCFYASHRYLMQLKLSTRMIKELGDRVKSDKFKRGTAEQELRLYESVRQEFQQVGGSVDFEKQFNATRYKCSKEITKSVFSAFAVMNTRPLEIQQKDSIKNLKVMVVLGQKCFVDLIFKETNDSLTLLEVKGLLPVVERVVCFKEYKYKACDRNP